jgi:hypothetical protein
MSQINRGAKNNLNSVSVPHLGTYTVEHIKIIEHLKPSYNVRGSAMQYYGNCRTKHSLLCSYVDVLLLSKLKPLYIT